jgi:CRISPR-associated endonuclease/helicase Cas3
MNSELIAHVKKNADENWAKPQALDEHLKGVAKLAESFTAVFGSGNWGLAEGISHDIGKGREEWQRYLKTKSGYDEEATLETKKGKLDHSTPSAKFAEEVLGKRVGRILAYCIAGHHAGLPDWTGSQSSLSYRLAHANTDGIPSKYNEFLAANKPTNPPWKFDSEGLDMSLWIRMLFSSLVDADFLDTETYMEESRAQLRNRYLSIPELLKRFDARMGQMTKDAIGSSPSVVMRARQTVLTDCRKAATLTPGFFSLTVPTGGGKTLSSMAFALEHAAKYNKDRVIYVIPYTSIIEQNADVFRKAVGADQVVEHHSNLDDDDSTPKLRLAAENWDAPLIVTTSVQFFESLFAAKTSRCRKLHNIANSVVVLDEAQLLPTDFLEPIIATMKLLADHYATSFVICTATQPVLERQEGFPRFPGLPYGCIREIVSDVPSLYHDLKRVEVHPPDDLRTPKTWDEIVAELMEEDRVLCIVSDRKSCREIYTLMPKGSYHLSALMCAQHRSDRIAEIKERLKTDSPVRLVSTQLVEAGVDFSFPTVYRAMAGLDSIAQAAGRCNREGELTPQGRLGKVVIFVPPRKSPAGILRKAADTASIMIQAGLLDPIDSGAFAPYFSALYWKANSLDAKGIINLLKPDPTDFGIQFRTAADAFHIIDEKDQKAIIVPYGEGEKLISELKSIGPDRWLLRKLQRYTVNIYGNQFRMLQDRGSIEEVSPGIFALICAIEYSDDIGILVDEMPIDPGSYML